MPGGGGEKQATFSRLELGPPKYIGHHLLLPLKEPPTPRERTRPRFLLFSGSYNKGWQKPLLSGATELSWFPVGVWVRSSAWLSDCCYRLGAALHTRTAQSGDRLPGLPSCSSQGIS